MLQGYLEELRKTPLFEPAEERELWEKSAQGDLAAHQRLMTCYQPLVFKIATSFKLPEAETMELIQEGMVGLLEAAESYDYTRQVAFSLFASSASGAAWWITCAAVIVRACFIWIARLARAIP